jgi:hypothetical protein
MNLGQELCGDWLGPFPIVGGPEYVGSWKSPETPAKEYAHEYIFRPYRHRTDGD